MEAYSTFGEVVRTRRRELGIGLREFAATMAMPTRFVSQIETDKVVPVADNEIIDLARYLHVDTDYLFAMAGRLAPDVPEILRNHPQEFANFVRKLRVRDRRMFSRDHGLAERNRWLKSYFTALDREHPRYD